MRRALTVTVLAAAALLAAAASAAAQEPAPWKAAEAVRGGLFDAQSELILGGAGSARTTS